MGSRGAFEDVNRGNFTFKQGRQQYFSIGKLSSDPNIEIIYQKSERVKAPEFSHTAGRIYAVEKDGELKHLAYYDSNHTQTICIDFLHEHKGVKPHVHYGLQHGKDLPGIPPNSEQKALIAKIKKEYHLK